MESKEIWKDVYPVDKYKGYQVSNFGRVRSCRDYRKGYRDEYKIITPHLDKDGYLYISISDKNMVPRKQINRKIHRMVAEAFLGPQPGLVINHIDGNKQNNHLDNLEWVTAEENSMLAAKAGLYKTKPIEIIETGERFKSIRECAEAIDVCAADINHCLSGKIKHLKGLHFRYIDDYGIEPRVSTSFLYDYQMDAVNRLHNGSILCGSVGSGKSRSGLFYYFKECGGWIDENGYQPMKKPKDLIIITTAKKRDSLEWLGELSHFLLYPDKDGKTKFGNTIIVDSWNNIGKYANRQNCFFLLDEQRLVSYGAWTKTFLTIAKHNDWILLSATPGDTYIEYLPVFLANGFFRNKTEFKRNHIIYSPYVTKYPKIEGYTDTRRLDRLIERVLVTMDYTHEINKHDEHIFCDYDIRTYKDIIKNRWDIYNDEPIQQAAGMCYTLRRLINSDESRQVKVLEILENHPRAIIFYSFDYERDILLNLAYSEGTEVAEWTGHKHQPIPDSDKWVYICQYTSACEGWECIRTNCIIFFSQTYSYKVLTQAAGRVDRLNTPYDDLYYYHLKSRSGIDLAISKALKEKKKFNERKFTKWDK